MKGPKLMKRIGIFYFHDDHGVVDDYICKLLREAEHYTERLVIVCNGMLSPEGRKKFRDFSGDIIVREDRGYNAEAYKEAFHYLGLEIKKYEEVILFDSTILGPIFSLKEVFHTMDAREVDFWGITKIQGAQAGQVFSGYFKSSYLPDYIECYFIAIRSTMIASYEFWQFWRKLPEIHSVTEAIVYYEIGFTEKFSNYGFKWDVYADDVTLSKNSRDPLLWQPVSFLKQTQCPFVKVKSLVHSEYPECLYNGRGETTKELYDYLKNETEYDVEYIWNYVLRVNTMPDIKRSFQLQYVLASNRELNFTGKKTAGLLIIADSGICMEKYITYLRNAADAGMDLHVICEESVEDSVRKLCSQYNTAICGIQYLKSYREYAEKLVEMCDTYQYICSIDFSLKNIHGVKALEEGVIRSNIENMIKSEGYISSIIQLFDKNPKMGIMVPPTPIHADYSRYIGWEWGKAARSAEKVAKEVHVPFEYKKPAIAPYKGAFWCRSSALKTLKKYIMQCKKEDELFEKSDFARSVLYVCLPIFVQNMRFYAAVVMNELYAGIEMTNLRFFLEEMKKNTSPHSDNKCLIELLKGLEANNKEILKR